MLCSTVPKILRPCSDLLPLHASQNSGAKQSRTILLLEASFGKLWAIKVQKTGARSAQLHQIEKMKFGDITADVPPLKKTVRSFPRIENVLLTLVRNPPSLPRNGLVSAGPNATEQARSWSSWTASQWIARRSYRSSRTDWDHHAEREASMRSWLCEVLWSWRTSEQALSPGSILQIML